MSHDEKTCVNCMGVASDDDRRPSEDKGPTIEATDIDDKRARAWLRVEGLRSEHRAATLARYFAEVRVDEAKEWTSIVTAQRKSAYERGKAEGIEIGAASPCGHEERSAEDPTCRGSCGWGAPHSGECMNSVIATTETQYWEGGWIRKGHLAICPECGDVKEGTATWHLAHEAKCDWNPAGTWLKKRIASELAHVRERATVPPHEATVKNIVKALRDDAYKGDVNRDRVCNEIATWIENYDWVRP